MLEGLAVWALFIYLLRLIGMPWVKGTKAFAFLGGTAWLLFVWVGLINYTPMDLSGGSVVQSPHIQLRPVSTQIKGHVKALHVKPNQTVTEGQLIYEIDPMPYQISLDIAKSKLESANVALDNAHDGVAIANAHYLASKQDIMVNENELIAAKDDLLWKRKTLKRYQDQNSVVAHTITESQLDQQKTSVNVAASNATMIESKIEKSTLSTEKSLLEWEQSKLNVESKASDRATAIQQLKQAQWNLDNTKVYAPTNGYVTNFIMREGQYVGVAPRIQMYTNEKYVLMRVNHQAIRNVKVGQMGEFTSPVYPGKIFSTEVEGIIEATGEAQGNLLGREDSVRQTTGKNVQNKHHFVRLKVAEHDGYDLPVGSVGLAWISGEKPIGFMGFLDVIRGVIIRMKSQIYYFYSM